MKLEKAMDQQKLKDSIKGLEEEVNLGKQTIEELEQQLSSQTTCEEMKCKEKF